MSQKAKIVVGLCVGFTVMLFVAGAGAALIAFGFSTGHPSEIQGGVAVICIGSVIGAIFAFLTIFG